MLDVLRIGASLPPVLVFLTALVTLDSYKLVTVRSILFSIAAGILAAAVSLGMNHSMLTRLPVDVTSYSRYVAPVVEEVAKAIYILVLLRRKRIGFMVDAAIYGFAVGSGFALAENLYYLFTLDATSPMVWLIRGFGTAIMHGGTTAILAVLAKSLADSRSNASVAVFLPGFIVAVVVHSAFNHLLVSPVISTTVVLILLPALLWIVFARSEQAARTWLGVGFDTEVSLLEMVTKGEIASTRVGEYLRTLQDKFKPEVVADLLCYLRVHLELSIQAKGILMMREAGFDVPPDPAVKEQFAELEYLRKSIGRTGVFALAPLLRTTDRDLWQYHMLES